MNRGTKFFLIGVMIGVYVLIILNFNQIRYGLQMVRLYNENKKVENVVDNTQDDEKPVLDNPLEDIISKKDVDNLHNTTSPSPESESKTDSTKSYISIVNDYNSKLENLQAKFQGDLDNLLAQCFEDYSKGDLSDVKLASNYLALGAKLEKSSDNQFKALIKDMETELEANNQDTSIIKEIKAYYTDFKDSKKSALISSGMKYLNQ